MLNSEQEESRLTGIDLPVSAIAAVPVKFTRTAASKRVKESLFTMVTAISGIAVLFAITWIGLKLFAESALTRNLFGLKFLTGTVWDVPHEQYGALTFIYGTVVSSIVAILIAVPISVGTSIFLNELGHKKLTRPIGYFIELLAAIPSVVYGLWGVFVLCPWLSGTATPWLMKNFGFLPIFEGPAFQQNVLAAGVILAIMISPFITSVVGEVFRSLPTGLREASLALGGNRWETIRSVVLPSSRGGIVAAVMLGLGRALGETMAVVMVIGNNPQIKASLLQSGYSMPALLANQFNEASTDELQRSALIEIALLLFLVTLIVNGLARLMVATMNRHGAKGWRSQGLRNAVDHLMKGASAVMRVGLVAGVGLPLFVQAIKDFQAVGFGALLRPSALIFLAAALFLLIRNSNLAKKRWDHFRRGNQFASLSGTVICGVLSCIVLAMILSYIAVKGGKGFSLSILTQLPRPPGESGGGLKSAILGTVELVAMAAAIGVPLGILGGVYLAEFKASKLRNVVRFAADVLGGVPSVVIGLFAYAAFVLPFKHFSALAGSMALAMMMIPTVMRITEEILRLVPDALREASQGLGATRFETTVKVVLPAARAGILTGVMLSVARISGETAPLLFTAFGSDQLSWKPTEPVSSLTMKIYQYAGSPYDDWISQAWSGALVLVVMVLMVSLLARTTAVRTGDRFRAFRRG